MSLAMLSGAFSGACTEMTVIRGTSPAFARDIQHDLRDHLAAQRLATLSDWMTEATGLYLRTADILRRRQREALAITLDEDDRLDARTFRVAHDHMAAHSRAMCLHTVIAGAWTSGLAARHAGQHDKQLP